MVTILRLSQCGTPIGWIGYELAASLAVKEQIIWSLGESCIQLTGGINKQGERSTLSLPAIIATAGVLKQQQFTPALSNELLFRRDQQTCLYCGNQFPREQLSRDHIQPQARGGRDTWTNVVTACLRCNHRKACRTPEEANMPLLAVPYKPNRFEFMALANRKILADQMAFLQRGFSKNMPTARQSRQRQ